jgi:hypothetical protein
MVMLVFKKVEFNLTGENTKLEQQIDTMNLLGQNARLKQELKKLTETIDYNPETTRVNILNQDPLTKIQSIFTLTPTNHATYHRTRNRKSKTKN